MKTNQKGIISLDWGAIWDILSIFDVKIEESSGGNVIKNLENYYELSCEIRSQIGEEFYKVINSKEYKELYLANKKTFKKIEEVQKSNGLAKQVDGLNYKRFLKKCALQKKYFGGNISEVKLGYK